MKKYEYWFVDALGKIAVQVSLPPELCDSDGRIKKLIRDFWGRRMIEKIKIEYTEEQILKEYHENRNLC